MKSWTHALSQLYTTQRKPQAFPIHFAKKKKYIFFSWVGFFHWVAVMMLALFSLNYNNNLSILAVCFLLVFYSSVLFTNYNVLKKITAVSCYSKPVEEGEVLEMVFEFRCEFGQDNPQVWMRVHDTVVPLEVHEGLGKATWRVVPEKFGVFDFPSFSLFTFWPMGLNKTWVFARPIGTWAVAPRRTQPESNNIAKGHVMSDELLSSTMGEPDGVRPLFSNERGKMAWKHTVKHQKPMTYTYTSSERKVLYIDWPNDQRTDEEKLLWVRQHIDHALEEGMSFQVRHPDFVSQVGAGPEFATMVLCLLMPKVFPPTEWVAPSQHRKAWWKRLVHWFGQRLGRTP